MSLRDPLRRESA